MDLADPRRRREVLQRVTPEWDDELRPISSSSRSSHGMQCATSGAFGSRFFGGRALTTLVIQTSSRTRPGLGQQLVEQLPGAADERTPELVLGRAGRLADEHDARRGVPFPGTIRDAVSQGSKPQPRVGEDLRA